METRGFAPTPARPISVEYVLDFFRASLGFNSYRLIQSINKSLNNQSIIQQSIKHLIYQSTKNPSIIQARKSINKSIRNRILTRIDWSNRSKNDQQSINHSTINQTFDLSNNKNPSIIQARKSIWFGPAGPMLISGRFSFHMLTMQCFRSISCNFFNTYYFAA